MSHNQLEAQTAWGFLLEVNETHRVDGHHHRRPLQGDSAALLVHSPLAGL